MLAWAEEAQKAIKQLAGQGVDTTPLPTRKRYQEPPFSVKSIRKDGNDYFIKLNPGWIIAADPIASAGGSDGYAYIMPEAGGTPLDDDNPPEIQVADGETIYAKLEVDTQGTVSDPVTVEASTDEKTIHYQPDDPEGAGVDGNYHWRRLVKFELVDSKPKLTRYQQSDIEFDPFLWTGENKGGGAKVFKEHKEEDGEYHFRSLTGLYAIDIEEGTDVIEFAWEGENIGAGAEVYKDDGTEGPNDKAQFRTLKPGVSGTQQEIQVSQIGSNIHINGNGVSGTFEILDCDGNSVASIDVQDGLVTGWQVAQTVRTDCGS